jgi:putative transposase
MPRGLKRYYGKGDLHFVTFSCYRRWPLLGSWWARSVFVSELGRARTQYGFRLVGYVVMPEHVHVLMSEPGKGTVSTVLQMAKQRVSRRLRKRKRWSGAGQMAFGFAGEEGGHEHSGWRDFTISMCIARGRGKRN